MIASKKKYLFIPLSGYGTLFPAIKLAHILQAQGESVSFAIAAEYSKLLEINGLNGIEIRNQSRPYPFLSTSHWYSDSNIVDEVKVLGQIIEHLKPDYIITNPLVLASFILAERYDIPTINIGYFEYLYPGLHDSDPTKNWRIKDITRYYNESRAKLGLHPISLQPTASPLIGDQYLLRSIPEMNESLQLPAQIHHIGSLYWEPSYINIELDQFIAFSQQQGRPIIYLQIGRLFENRETWNLLFPLLAKSNMNFVMDIGRADYLSPAFKAPSNFYIHPFIPLGKIATAISFVICSAQSTSVLSAILHGKQMLCIPHSADAHELSNRLVNKGLAYGLHQKEEITEEVFIDLVKKIEAQTLSGCIEKYQSLFADYDHPDLVYQKIKEF